MKSKLFSLISAFITVFIILSVGINASSDMEEAFYSWRSGLMSAEEAKILSVNINNEACKLMSTDSYEAERWFNRALEINPDDDAIRTNLAVMYINQNDYSQAASELERMSSLYSSPELMGLLARAREKLGHHSTAEKLWRSALRENPSYDEGLLGLGALLYKVNKLEEAVEYLRQAANSKNKNISSNARSLLKKAERHANVEQDFYEDSSGNFRLSHAENISREKVEKILKFADEAYSTAGAELQLYPRKPAWIIMYDGVHFGRATRAPHWSGGLYDGKIRLPVDYLLYDDSELNRVLLHEYTHLLIHELGGPSVPVWLNEGIAQWISGDRPSNTRILALKNSNSLPSLSKLKGSFSSLSQKHADLAYAVSLSVVAHIIDAHGMASIRRILTDIKDNSLRGNLSDHDFDTILRSTLWNDLKGLEKTWLERI